MSEGTDGSERMIADWTRRVQQQAQRYQAMADTVGTEDETAATVFADAKRTFPEPPDEEEPDPPQADTEFRFGPEGDDPADGSAGGDPAPPAGSSRPSRRPRGRDRDSGDEPDDDDFGGRSIFS